MNDESKLNEPGKSRIIDNILGSAKRMNLLQALLPMAALGGAAGLVTGLRKAKIDAEALKAYGPAEYMTNWTVRGDKFGELLSGSRPDIIVTKVNKIDKPFFGKVRSADVNFLHRAEPKIKTPKEELKFKAKSVASSTGIGVAEATVAGTITEFFRNWGAGDRSKAATEDSIELLKLAASNKAKRALIDAEIHVRYAEALGKAADELRQEMEKKASLSPDIEALMNGFRI